MFILLAHHTHKINRKQTNYVCVFNQCVVRRVPYVIFFLFKIALNTQKSVIFFSRETNKRSELLLSDGKRMLIPIEMLLLTNGSSEMAQLEKKKINKKLYVITQYRKFMGMLEMISEMKKEKKNSHSPSLHFQYIITRQLKKQNYISLIFDSFFGSHKIDHINHRKSNENVPFYDEEEGHSSCSSNGKQQKQKKNDCGFYTL